MTDQLSPNQDTPDVPPAESFVAAEARDRVETERLVGRKRRTWRIVLALVASALLLLLALGLRRDQVRREQALEELRAVADRLDRWVHENGALPRGFALVFGESEAAELAKRFEYTDEDRLRLTIGGALPIALAFGKEPRRLTLISLGRPVMFYSRGNFDVRWLDESEFIQHRGRESSAIGKGRETPRIQP
jgi:hypothetical protein